MLAVINKAAETSPLEELWVAGKEWIASPDPKNILAGIHIFKSICDANPLDYWGHILYGGCKFWSGQGKHTNEEALAILQRARELDPRYPHAYSIAAQVLQALHRGEEAVGMVQALLEREDLLLEETDHYQKIVEGLQVQYLVFFCTLVQKNIATAVVRGLSWRDELLHTTFICNGNVIIIQHFVSSFYLLLLCLPLFCIFVLTIRRCARMYYFQRSECGTSRCAAWRL